MKDERGSLVVELLVGSACGALAGAAAMTLLAHGASASAAIGERVRAADSTRVCRNALVTGLDAGLRSLEGTTAVRGSGGVTHRVVPTLEGVEVLVAAGKPVEINGTPTGPYQSSQLASVGLVVGSRVVALPPDRPWGIAVVGTVTAVDPDAGSVTVAWDAAAALAAAPPRAVAPVESVEFRARARDGAIELQQRRNEGNWQPVVGGLAAVELGYLLDTDGDGQADEGPVVATGPLSGILAVHVRCFSRDGRFLGGWADR